MYPNATIGVNAVVGDFVTVSGGIAHDCVIGDYVTLSGDATLSGHVTAIEEILYHKMNTDLKKLKYWII